ncbi:MAG: hypothetical protein JRC88_10645, partial [Deltaproteobacteria bacterium]|nr:hypothetical protein [Deltaproteobacteria bacterium]
LDRLKKYKDKAIIIFNKTTRPDKKKKASNAESKKEQQPKTPVPASRENLSSPGKQETVGKQEKQILEVKVKKESLVAKPVIETSVVSAETDTSLPQKLKTEEEIPSQQDRKERLESFLNIYCQTYASKDLDKFVTFFTSDATENNKPFQDMLTKYRKNMEKIKSFNYRIELVNYSLLPDTGNISVQGKYFNRFLLHEGTWQENSGSISMELTENGNSYLVKRLNYEK